MNFLVFFLAICLFLAVHHADAQNYQSVGNTVPVNRPSNSNNNWLSNVWPPNWWTNNQNRPNYPGRPNYPQPYVPYFCPQSVKNSFCSKNTSFIYKVLENRTSDSNQTTYTINITTPLIPTSLEGGNATLIVPKNDTKHTIKINETYLYMCSNVIENRTIVLNTTCYNKPVSSLSSSDMAFLANKGYGNEPIYSWFCEKKQNSSQCQVRNCFQKCQTFCQNCDDQAQCESECQKRCEVYFWYQDRQGNSYSYRALDHEMETD